MSTLSEVREAITHLSVQERAILAAELCGWEDDAWDVQMKQDAAAGHFQGMNNAALSEMTEGRCVPLEEGL
jgi:hypothetical protein